MNNNTPSLSSKAWITAAVMGLGHLRAAYPLRGIAFEGILVDGETGLCPPREYQVWRRLRRAYYFMSRTKDIPLVGEYLYRVLGAIQNIPSYYPSRDLSAPNFGTRYLRLMIEKQGMSASILEKIAGDQRPVVNAFYAAAMAIDAKDASPRDNYLLMCDTDFNRVWVAEEPAVSRIKYLVPCTKVKKRLLEYGVPEERIFLTGFPLPKENIGSAENMEILKEDLFQRLLRLDPSRRFFNFHEHSVEHFLGRAVPAAIPSAPFTLMFAIGGAGVQADMALSILKGVRQAVIDGKMRVVLSAGIRSDVRDRFRAFVRALRLESFCGRGIDILYHDNAFSHFDAFNRALRTADILWTKPSELTFYCALGIPILTSQAVGSHEEKNTRWLQDVHAGVHPGGALEHAGEWLSDLRDSGVLAEAAWDGFLKGRKLGAYRIEELVTGGNYRDGVTPLDR